MQQNKKDLSINYETCQNQIWNLVYTRPYYPSISPNNYLKIIWDIKYCDEFHDLT